MEKTVKLKVMGLLYLVIVLFGTVTYNEKTIGHKADRFSFWSR